VEIRARRRAADEAGFTLLELMVVVLIIAVLIAIAVPAFLGSRTRASDRAAQSNVRNAHVTELIVYSDRQEFTDSVSELQGVDSSLSYTQALAAMSPRGNIVYVELLPISTSPNDTVLVGAKSASGRCFWIRSVGGMNLLRFADNDCSTTPAVGTFRDQW
jgi:type IV pilus assembly protein PilA